MDWRLLVVQLIVIASCLWTHVDSTCVFDSDFGFTLNCGFKKSGLFRVRNLGGVKGYVGLGFSVGDELGFPQSLSTSDTSKRRSTQGGSRITNQLGVQSMSKVNGIPRSVAQTEKVTNELGVQTVTTVNGVSKGSGRSMSGGYRIPAARQATIPPFKPIMPAVTPRPTALQYQHLMAGPAIMVSNGSRPSRLAYVGPLESIGGEVEVPPFQALPSSITKLSSVQMVSPMVGVQVVPAQQAFRNSLQAATNRFQVRQDAMAPGYDHGLATNSLTLRSGPPSAPQQQLVQSAPVKDIPSPTPLIKVEDSLMGHSIKALSQASNISEEAITAAIAVRQQQLLKQQQQAMLAATTTPKPTTLPPSGGSKKYALTGVNKVMNAPKEYYPVGYDKNFDDNFASRVELPDTSFYCGDQKHFPGLYSDEDLGCMVFHVCAFTDDGLIMKSFLCPESTLFDQTILKCNWWFYVDCKSSKKLYDSNIPISKSYQLMKALAFFSAYKKS